MDSKKLKRNAAQELSAVHHPVFFRLGKEEEHLAFEQLCSSDAVSFVHDEIMSQLKELMKCKHPSKALADEELNTLISQHLNSIEPDKYGVWVYYPWNRSVVHLLDEEEFVTVRTNRNQLKITPEEQATLQQKTIGIIGSSVGQSIALTLATERSCGALRLADFDSLELSNLNRIRAGVTSLGLLKVVITAREIAEIDPYIKVKIYGEGINQGNINSFLNEDGKLDIMVEVCDNIDMKVYSRLQAKAAGIPVVMDTNDRGMMDIERFDLEPDRPILHGYLEGLPLDNLQSLSPEERMSVILKIVGADSISRRLRLSIAALQKTIHALPQLASSVVLGGAITTDVCRRILLGSFNHSGRYYVDPEDIIKDSE
jgi:hypothetical protein